MGSIGSLQNILRTGNGQYSEMARYSLPYRCSKAALNMGMQLSTLQPAIAQVMRVKGLPVGSLLKTRCGPAFLPQCSSGQSAILPVSTDNVAEQVISGSSGVLTHAPPCPAETVCLAVDLKPEDITVVAMCPGDASWGTPHNRSALGL